MPLLVPQPPKPQPLPPETPHFEYPFDFTPSGAEVNEQDSLDDVFDCVQAIVACPVGTRNEEPAFGIPNLLGAQAPLNVTGLERAIQRWEPRAAAIAREYPDLLNEAFRHVQINVSAVQADR